MTGNGGDRDLLRREPEPEPVHTLVLLDILFCDNERDPEVLSRYFERFQLTLASLQAQQVPEAAELLVTIQMSGDKREWIERTEALLRHPSSSSRMRFRVWEYEHPPGGYEGGDPERIDWVKKPNLHSPLREQMFIDSHRGLRLDRYARVIRVGLDDDDLWMPWQTRNIVDLASAARTDPRVEHSGVLALGMLDTLVGYVGDGGVDVDSAQLKRSLTGEKFYVIDRPESVESIAMYSASGVPERVDLEFHQRLDRRGVGLYAVGGFVPGFVYMRWGQNLSRQGKEYLEAEQFGRTQVAAPEDVALVAQEDIPWSGRKIRFFVPGSSAPLRVTAQRVGTDVRVESNFLEQSGKGLKICFYLMRGTERIATRWYSADPDAVFGDAPRGVRVRAFLRATDGTTIRTESNVV